MCSASIVDRATEFCFLKPKSPEISLETYKSLMCSPANLTSDIIIIKIPNKIKGRSRRVPKLKLVRVILYHDPNVSSGLV
jgi:hypothetical protein